MYSKHNKRHLNIFFEFKTLGEQATNNLSALTYHNG
jgi:hypothetical protein